MFSFPVTSLPPVLLEQVINKLEGKSYLRLQQTCRDMAEFIQTSRHIQVHLDVHCKAAGMTSELRWIMHNGRKICYFNPESLYGVRTASFLPQIETRDLRGLEEVCNTLRRCRITTQEMDMDGMWKRETSGVMSSSMLTKEQCSLLFTTLRPSRFALDSVGSNRYEAILHCGRQIMERATITVDEYDGFSAAKHLLPRFQRLKISSIRSLVQEDCFSEVIQILQFLRAIPLPKLESFEYNARYRLEDRQLSIDEIVQEFSDFQAVAKKGPRSIPFTMKCKLGHVRSCDIRIESDSIKVTYPSAPSYRR